MMYCLRDVACMIHCVVRVGWCLIMLFVCIVSPKCAELSALQSSLTTEEARQQLVQLAEEVGGVGVGVCVYACVCACLCLYVCPCRCAYLQPCICYISTSVRHLKIAWLE